MDYPGLRMGTAGGSEAVHDQINLSQIFFYERNDLVLHVVRKGIAIDAFGIQPGLIGKAMESCGVVPAGGARLSLGTGFLKEHADGRSTGAKGRGDARGQSVAGGCTQYQHPLGTIGNGPTRLHVGYLPAHILPAPLGVGGGAKKSSDTGLDNHGLSRGLGFSGVG